MAKDEVNVTITCENGKIVVKNDRGMTWEMKSDYYESPDVSTCACVATAASQMLTSTITSQMYHSNHHVLSFTLSVTEE